METTMLLKSKTSITSLFILLIWFPSAAALSVKDQYQQYSEVKTALDELVLANHILYDQGALDGYGHISVRNPSNPQTFFIARSVAPSVVKLDDILEVDMGGKVLNDDKRTAYGERFIHSGILNANPTINSVIHGHAASTLPFGVTGTTLKPIYHMSAFLGEGAPIFEIRDFAKPSPDTDMFVSNPDLGAGLAKVMGNGNFVLMRGHGYAASAENIRKAVFRAIYAVQNASIQAEAMKMGKTQYLTLKEAEISKATIEKTINRPWELWSERVRNQK